MRSHTSQLALPADVCNTVDATAGYEQSVRNLAPISLDTDKVFSDGHSLQMATVTGEPTTGYGVQLNVGISPTSTNTQVASPGEGGPEH